MMASLEPIVYDQRVENNQDIIVFLPPSLHKSNRAKFQIFTIGDARRKQSTTRKSFIPSQQFVATGQQMKFPHERDTVVPVPVGLSKPTRLQPHDEAIFQKPHRAQAPFNTSRYCNHPEFRRNAGTSFSSLAREKLSPSVTNIQKSELNREGRLQNTFVNRSNMGVNLPSSAHHSGPQSIFQHYQDLSFGSIHRDDRNELQKQHFLDDAASLGTELFPMFQPPRRSNVSKPVLFPQSNRNTFGVRNRGMNEPLMLIDNEEEHFLGLHLDQNEELELLTEMQQNLGESVEYWPTSKDFVNNDMDVEEFQVENTSDRFQEPFLTRRRMPWNARRVQNNVLLRTPLRSKMAANRMQIPRNERRNNFQGRRRKKPHVVSY